MIWADQDTGKWEEKRKDMNRGGDGVRVRVREGERQVVENLQNVIQEKDIKHFDMVSPVV